MRTMKLTIPAVVLAAGFLLCTSASYGTQEYAKKEKKSCMICHAKTVKDKAEMTKNLTSVGTCYKENGHSLATCPITRK